MTIALPMNGHAGERGKSFKARWSSTRPCSRNCAGDAVSGGAALIKALLATVDRRPPYDQVETYGGES